MAALSRSGDYGGTVSAPWAWSKLEREIPGRSNVGNDSKARALDLFYNGTTSSGRIRHRPPRLLVR